MLTCNHIQIRNFYQTSNAEDLQVFFIHGPLASRGPQSPHFRGFMITLRPTTLCRTPLDELSARRRDTTQHSQEKDIYDPGGIRSRNSSKQVAANPHLRPRDHWDE